MDDLEGCPPREKARVVILIKLFLRERMNNEGRRQSKFSFISPHREKNREKLFGKSFGGRK